MANYGDHKDLVLNASPISLVRSGRYNVTANAAGIIGRTTDGQYWTSSFDISSTGYALFFTRTGIKLRGDWDWTGRQAGLALRCLAR